MSLPNNHSGALVIVGGGGTPPEVHDEFFRLAGGPLARVLHIPSATRTFDEIPNKREYYCEFYDRQPASFDFLHTYDRAEAETAAFAAPLESANAVWIGGGTQSRLADLFLDTNVMTELHRLLARGGVIGGTSSGAAIVSDAMICFGYEEIEFGQGFALYPRAIVDPHFTERERHYRLARAVLLRPDQIAIGVDEKTALVVQGHELRVVGPGETSAYFHFADLDSGTVERYRLGKGETAHMHVPVLGAPHQVLRDCLRDLRGADIITAAELVPTGTE